MVGASGFEPETSCAQASRAASWKSFLFNLVFENKRVRKVFGSGTMYRNVAPHAWSPPNFPIAKKRRTAIISQTNFVLSDTDLSAARGYSQNPPQFFRLGPPMPLGPKLPKLPLVLPNTLKWQHLYPSDFGAFGECWKMHLFSD